MIAFFKNPLAYLGTSFVLFLVALLLISNGSTDGQPLVMWIGFAALCVAALIPPVQRLIFGEEPSDAKPADNSSETKGDSQ